MKHALIILLGISILTSSCQRGPTPFRTAMNAAEAARREGDFEQERLHFTQAARLAKEPKDAAEARYRSATTWLRQGDYEKGAAMLEEFATKYPGSPRAGRAWLDAGRAWEKANEPEKALLAYAEVVRSYADSGGAGAAAERIVELWSEQEGAAQHKIYEQLLLSNSSPLLDEWLRYRYARALEKVSRRDAIQAYEDVARKHPLPRGSYSDEALLRAAVLRRAAGDSRGALTSLDLLLEHGGKAAFIGSYTRTAYVEALILRGRILRDDLNQPAAARQAFASLPERFPHSRLADEALFENIITLSRQGLDACGAVQKLRESSPESRYLRCEPMLCRKPNSREVDTNMCERWLAGIEKR